MSSQIPPKVRGFGLLRWGFREARDLHDLIVDTRLGISTRGHRNESPNEQTRFSDPVFYEPVYYYLLRRYLRELEINDEDTVFDIGCGSGRIVCLCAHLVACHCIGVEVSSALAMAATKNAASLRGRRGKIDIVKQDAALADYSTGTVFILNNPFGAPTLESVLKMIETSLIDSPRVIRFAYINPVHEYVFEATPWLHCFRKVQGKLTRFRATYWTNSERADGTSQ